MRRLANALRSLAAPCLALIVAAHPIPAAAKLQAVIVEWGEVEVGEPGGPLGPEYQEHSLAHGHEVGSITFLTHGDHVPAQLCRSFGLVAWLAAGPGETLPDRILLRVAHPVMTRPDGASGTEDTLMLPVANGAVRTSFGFDDPWEVRPGDWTFDLIQDGAVLASKTFAVAVPPPGTPAPVCPGRGVS